MNSEQFNHFLEECFNTVRRMMGVTGVKAIEYSTQSNRFHNFEKAALFTNLSPRKALWGMLAKHLVSIHDGIESNNIIAEEKLDDAINYLLLLKGLNRTLMLPFDAEVPVDATEITNLDDAGIAAEATRSEAHT